MNNNQIDALLEFFSFFFVTIDLYGEERLLKLSQNLQSTESKFDLFRQNLLAKIKQQIKKIKGACRGYIKLNKDFIKALRHPKEEFFQKISDFEPYLLVIFTIGGMFVFSWLITFYFSVLPYLPYATNKILIAVVWLIILLISTLPISFLVYLIFLLIALIILLAFYLQILLVLAFLFVFCYIPHFLFMLLTKFKLAGVLIYIGALLFVIVEIRKFLGN